MYRLLIRWLSPLKLLGLPCSEPMPLWGSLFCWFSLCHRSAPLSSGSGGRGDRVTFIASSSGSTATLTKLGGRLVVGALAWSDW